MFLNFTLYYFYLQITLTSISLVFTIFPEKDGALKRIPILSREVEKG